MTLELITANNIIYMNERAVENVCEVKDMNTCVKKVKKKKKQIVVTL